MEDIPPLRRFGKANRMGCQPSLTSFGKQAAFLRSENDEAMALLLHPNGLIENPEALATK
jgi:hypothetical protein